MRITVILLSIVVVLEIVLLKIKNQDSITALRRDNLEVSIKNQPKQNVEYEQKHRRIYLTILDCNKDTIATNEIYLPENNSYWNKFKSDSSYLITYSEFIKHSQDDNICAYDMAYMRVHLGIRQSGDLAFVKKEFSNKKNYKYNYVSNINWLKVNATQLSSEILDWDISVGGYSDFISEAVKKKWSYAKTKYYLQDDENENKNAFRNFMKNATDSVFKKGAYENFYYLSFSEWGIEEGDCFGIHDLGIISDINNDGFADRIASWHDYNTFGVCGITKKSKNGLIEFFHYSTPIN